MRNFILQFDKTICVGIGGSTTNDGGIGMAAGLGVAFYDDQGHASPVGASPGRVASRYQCRFQKALEDIELKLRM